MVETKPIYSDSLITINTDGILLKNYYFFRLSKYVPLDKFERIKVLKPSLGTGKWRWHGTGDFQYWFPADYKRHKRDAIFIAYMSSKGMDVGFTVEDSPQVISLLQQKGLFGDTDIQTEGTPGVSLRTKPRGQLLFISILLFSGVFLPLISILIVVFLKLAS